MSIHDTTDADAVQPTEPQGHAPLAADDDQRDRLTILRLLLLTAGVAVGLVIFAPRITEAYATDTDQWRGLASAVIIGLGLPAPLFCVRRPLRGRQLGAGGLFALTAGLGSLVILPAAVIAMIANGEPKGMPVVCPYYCLPLVGLWYLLAALLSGHAGRHLFRPETPWTERYGFLLALLWSPLGVWVLVDIYRDVL
jgi:hypothetical protein